MEYKFTVGQFSGPLEALLGLIEEKKLSISEVSLAEVTDDFLAYLDVVKKEVAAGASEFVMREHLRVLSDFIVIASRLIFIKSRSLLPEMEAGPEEEADVKDLTARLDRYKRFKPAMGFLTKLWRRKEASVSRPYLFDFHDLSRAGRIPGVCYPGGALTAVALASSLRVVREGIERVTRENQTIRDRIVSIEEKVEEIVRYLTQDPVQNFASLSHKKSRGEVIAIFLALLHLAREQQVFLEQQAHLSDIIITRHET